MTLSDCTVGSGISTVSPCHFDDLVLILWENTFLPIAFNCGL